MPLPSIDAPGKYDLTIYQGSRFSRTLTFRNKTTGLPLDLSGTTAKAQIRKSVNDPTAIDLAIDLTDSNIGILIISLTTAQSKAMTGSGDKKLSIYGIWDLELSLGSDTVRLLEGNVMLSLEVTK